jgi:hypothetical protein
MSPPRRPRSAFGQGQGDDPEGEGRRDLGNPAPAPVAGCDPTFLAKRQRPSGAGNRALAKRHGPPGVPERCLAKRHGPSGARNRSQAKRHGPSGVPECVWRNANDLPEPSADDFPPLVAFRDVRGQFPADRRFLAARRAISRRSSRPGSPPGEFPSVHGVPGVQVRILRGSAASLDEDPARGRPWASPFRKSLLAFFTERCPRVGRIPA